MSEKPFEFKQFSVNQSNCAMKLGTDGVLLGAWAPIDHYPNSILDIGAGTGIIALMLAQRCDAQQIDAIEIDDDAYEQATENFENSPWGDRLFCFHAGIDELIDEPEDLYDLIVSNPPFFSEDYKSDDDKRNLARFQDALPFELLVEAADTLLSDEGILAVIVPYQEQKRLVDLALEKELFLTKETLVKGNPEANFKRSLLSFSRQKPLHLESSTLIIETQRHQYTEEYIALTKDFYKKM